MAEAARKTSRNKRPISRHPLFPATVALWFAAILGLIAFAATQRTVAAIVLACLGGMAGAVIARRIARPKAGNAQYSPAAAPAPDAEYEAAQFTADDFCEQPDGAGDFASPASSAIQPAAPVRDHREVPEQEITPPAFTEPMPLAYRQVQVLNVNEFGIDRLPEFRPDAPDTGEEAESASDESAPDSPSDGSGASDHAGAFAAESADEAANEAAGNPAAFAAPAEPVAETPPMPAPKGIAAQRIASADLEKLSHLELLERLALSLESHREKQRIAAQAAKPGPPEQAHDDESGAEAASPREDGEAPVEPVIAFPGQMPASGGTGTERPFDMPGAAGSTDRTERGVSSKFRDSRATEKALRDALATLQRLSGTG